MITCSMFAPVFEHEAVHKIGPGPTIVHHVVIRSADDTVLRINLHGMNDRQRQLVYELFGRPKYEDETKGDSKIDDNADFEGTF